MSKAKSELALLEKNLQNTSPMQRIKIMRDINKLVDKVREAEMQRDPFRSKKAPEEGEEVSKEALDHQL